MTVQAIRNEIIVTTNELFNLQIDELLSICKSEIERIMLLRLYQYFLKAKEKFGPNKFCDLRFIEVGYDEVDYMNPFAVKIIGLGVSLSMTEPVTSWTEAGWSYNSPVVVTRTFEILPQYEISIDGKKYHIDIAIISNRISDGNTIESSKIALECDGFDKSLSQVDSKLERRLKINGWKGVFRYSSEEILALKGLEEMDEIFNDIIKMLYL